ncbi:hypothetical protein [Streptomyces sp. NPDC005322]|uniref:hypothetical protein n=1 Tax=Streptomyces sp. NPDC005322 TaxID=3157032 RepID=UPI0033A80665
MTEKSLTHKQALAKVIQALGGTWDTERAVPGSSTLLMNLYMNSWTISGSCRHAG